MKVEIMNLKGYYVIIDEHHLLRWFIKWISIAVRKLSNREYDSRMMATHVGVMETNMVIWHATFPKVCNQKIDKYLNNPKTTMRFYKPILCSPERSQEALDRAKDKRLGKLYGLLQLFIWPVYVIWNLIIYRRHKDNKVLTNGIVCSEEVILYSKDTTRFYHELFKHIDEDDRSPYDLLHIFEKRRDLFLYEYTKEVGSTEITKVS